MLDWSDVSDELDWIAAFAQRPEPACFLLIGTFRPLLAVAPEHPLTAIADDLRIKGFCREIALAGLDESNVAEYAALRCPPAPGQGKRMRRLAKLVHQQTGGNPLFTVNVFDNLAARGLLVSENGRWTLTREVNRVELGMPDDIRRMIGKLIGPPAARRARGAGRRERRRARHFPLRLSPPPWAVRWRRSNRRCRPWRDRVNLFVEAGTDRMAGRDAECALRLPSCTATCCTNVFLRPVSRTCTSKWPCESRMAYGDKAPEIAAELAMHFERCGELRPGRNLSFSVLPRMPRAAARTEAQTHFNRALALLACWNRPAPGESGRELEVQIGRGAVIMAARGWERA